MTMTFRQLADKLADYNPWDREPNDPIIGLAPQHDEILGWVYVPAHADQLTDDWWDGSDVAPENRPPFIEFAKCA